MRKSKLLTLIGSICLILVLAALLFMTACPAPPAEEEGVPPPAEEEEAPPETYTLKYSGWLPPGSEMEMGPEWWAEEVEKRTNGRVTVEMYPAESLGKYPDFPEMVKGGVCDAALLAGMRFDRMLVFELPFVCPNRAITNDAFYSLYYRGLLPELRNDYKVLWYQPCDPTYLFLADKKIVSPDDYEGIKVRGISGPWAEFPDALGATGVVVPSTDVYMSLERGIIDGAITTVEFVFIAKLHEVIKYCIWEPISEGGSVFAMSRDTWNSLPADIQVIMQQINDEGRYKFVEMAFKTSAEDYAALTEAGLEVYDLSSEERTRWYDTGKQVTDAWVAEKEAEGLPIQEMLDVIERVKQLYR